MQLALINMNDSSNIEKLLLFAKKEGIDMKLFQSEEVEDYLVGKMMEETKNSPRNSPESIKKSIKDALHGE